MTPILAGFSDILNPATLLWVAAGVAGASGRSAGVSASASAPTGQNCCE